jgi:hypothetical protein
MGGVIKVTKILFLASLLAWGVTFFIIRQVPKGMNFEEALKTLPVLNEYESEEFKVNSGEFTARLEPVGSYEIYGFVVAEYDAENWLDITHEHDPFNTKDLCLIWGDNAQDTTYEDYKFWHGEFTCFTKPKDWPVEKELSYAHVTNNHLIPANESIYKKIKRSHIGDQVRIKGELVNYRIETAGFQTGTRYTSKNPFDNNCEVIYTTEFEILKSANSKWRQINLISLALVPLLFLVLVILWMIELKPKKHY